MMVCIEIICLNCCLPCFIIVRKNGADISNGIIIQPERINGKIRADIKAFLRIFYCSLSIQKTFNTGFLSEERRKIANVYIWKTDSQVVPAAKGIRLSPQMNFL